MESTKQEGFLYLFASNTVAVLLLMVILGGTASVLVIGFGVDKTLASAIGLGCWYAVRLLIKRRLKKAGR